MSLVVFCLLFSFVDYVPVKGEILWYLSLTAWLISLSIMLSSSIHAIAKGTIFMVKKTSSVLPIQVMRLKKATSGDYTVRLNGPL